MKKLFAAFLGALSLLVFGLILPTGDGVAGPEPASIPLQSQADTVFIQIVPDADSVVAMPSSVTVAPGQVVTWTTELGEWRVNFRSPQPFGESAVSQGIGAGRGERGGRAVRAEAANGSYKYDILVIRQGAPNLRADPEIVVRRGGGSR